MIGAMKKLQKVLVFWYDFLVGDDWRMAGTVIAALAITFGLSRAAITSWWVLPLAILFVLPYSIWRAARRRA
jgi:hypothetical protein